MPLFRIVCLSENVNLMAPKETATTLPSGGYLGPSTRMIPHEKDRQQIVVWEDYLREHQQKLAHRDDSSGQIARWLLLSDKILKHTEKEH